MSRRIHKLDVSDWPAEIGFVPFVGPRYEEGIDGARVLLLGESHYRKEGLDNSPEITRPYTRTVFGDRTEPTRTAGDGRYFPPLDRLLTNNAAPPNKQAAAAWEKVAFSNLIQEFVGASAGGSRTGTQFRNGTRVHVEHVLPVLRPDVILVLGRATWRGFDAGSIRNDLQPYYAKHVRSRHQAYREIWSLPYKNGEALMTWTYHPSRSVDTWADMAGALQHIAALGRNHSGRSST